MKKALIVSAKANMILQFNKSNIMMLKQMGYDVTVATNFKEPGTIPLSKSKDFYNRLLSADINPINICFRRSPIDKSNFKAYQQLKDLISDNSYDLIHCHSPVGGALTRLAAKKARDKGTKVIYTAHGFHFYEGAPMLNWLTLYPAERILSKFTDTLITINEEDYKVAQSFQAKRVTYIPGVGIDLKSIQVNHEKVAKIKEDLEISDEDHVLCSIGELNQNKNQMIVLEALSRMNDENIKYLIVGAGEMQEKLIEKVKEYNLEKQVTFLGYREDIYELLSLSDIFVFPSHREGLSRSLMEAMAMGKPVIASDIRGNRDLIDDQKGGLLFEPTDPKQLSENIQLMVNDQSFRQKASTYNFKKVEQFSTENVLSRMANIY